MIGFFVSPHVTSHLLAIKALCFILFCTVPKSEAAFDVGKLIIGPSLRIIVHGIKLDFSTHLWSVNVDCRVGFSES